MTSGRDKKIVREREITKMSQMHRHKSAYRYEYDRPPLRAGLRYRLQRAHFGKCAVRSARFSSVAAGNLAEGLVVEERDDDHRHQDHVDDVVDRCDGVEGAFGGNRYDAASSCCTSVDRFCVLCLC